MPAPVNQWGLGGGVGSPNYERNIRSSGRTNRDFELTYTPEWGSPFDPKETLGGAGRPNQALDNIRAQSSIARDLLKNTPDAGFGRTWFYNKSFGGGQRGQEILTAGKWNEAVAAAKQEKNFLSSEQSKEKDYDQAVVDVNFARGLAEEASKRAVGAVQGEAIAAGSAAQAGIAGGSKAGRTLEGEFKTDYESGSVLPASWMRQELDAEKIAAQKTGITDREGPAKMSYGGKEYSFARSARQSFAPARTGLGS